MKMLMTYAIVLVPFLPACGAAPEDGLAEGERVAETGEALIVGPGQGPQILLPPAPDQTAPLATSGDIANSTVLQSPDGSYYPGEYAVMVTGTNFAFGTEKWAFAAHHGAVTQSLCPTYQTTARLYGYSAAFGGWHDLGTKTKTGTWITLPGGLGGGVSYCDTQVDWSLEGWIVDYSQVEIVGKSTALLHGSILVGTPIEEGVSWVH